MHYMKPIKINQTKAILYNIKVLKNKWLRIWLHIKCIAREFKINNHNQ